MRRLLKLWGLFWVHVWCFIHDHRINLRGWEPWVFEQMQHYYSNRKR